MAARQQTLSPFPVPSDQKAHTASPASSSKTLRQAVEGLPSSFQHNNSAQYDHKLAVVDLAFRQHRDRLRVLAHKAKTAARESNELCLVLYGVSEEFKDKLDKADIAYQHLDGIVPKAVNQAINMAYQRLGGSSSKPRPLLIKFASDEEKHGL